MALLFKILIPFIIYIITITAYEGGTRFIGDKYSYVLNIQNFETGNNCTGAQIDTYWVLATESCVKFGADKVTHAVWAMIPSKRNKTKINKGTTPPANETIAKPDKPEKEKPKNRTAIRSLASKVFPVGNQVSLIKLMWPITMKPAAGLGLIPMRYDVDPLKYQDVVCTSVGYTKKLPGGPPLQIFCTLDNIGAELCCKLKTAKENETAERDSEGAPLICENIIIGLLAGRHADGKPRQQFCFFPLFPMIKTIIETIVKNDYNYIGQGIISGATSCLNQNYLVGTVISVILCTFLFLL